MQFVIIKYTYQDLGQLLHKLKNYIHIDENCIESYISIKQHIVKFSNFCNKNNNP